MTSDINVIVLAAGLGTRMRSKCAKVLHRAGGLTLIEHVVNTASAVTTPDRITVVLGHQAAEVRKVLENRGVRFVVQHEQKGTGHAVMVAKDSLPPGADLLLVLYGDTPLLSAATLERLIETQEQAPTAATLITTRLHDPSGYGRVVLDDTGRVKAIVEHRAATPEQLAINLINSGIYCFRSDLLWAHIDKIRPDNPARELYLTDMPEIFNQSGYNVAAMEVQDARELLGINTRVDLAAVDRIFRDRKATELMLSGVTIERPETVTIDPEVRAGMDSLIEPFVQLLGNTIIGEDCRIGAGSIVTDSVLARGVQVAPFTLITGAEIEERALIGPYARVRPDTQIGPGAHVGNFVELKKTRLGAGAKANHLAYLGDAEIGENTNIGAGTITCNYDGVEKHRTQVGKRAFVGSNSTLVAPVIIGDESYIGAGSVITETVPQQALALGRGRQVNKEGWVRKRRTSPAVPSEAL